MDTKELILRISRLRQEKGLSARKLSLKIGKHETYINRLEQRGFEPSFSTINDIVTVCGATLEEFFAEDSKNFKTDKQILDVIKNLSKEKRQSLLEFLKS